MISSRSEHWDREEALEGALVLVVHSRRISERSSVAIDDDGDVECNTETERLADAETERLEIPLQFWTPLESCMAEITLES
jgi:hypothetical protein